MKHEIDFDFLKYDFRFLKLKLVISVNEVCIIRNKTKRKLLPFYEFYIMVQLCTLRNHQGNPAEVETSKVYCGILEKFATFRIMIKVLR